MSIDPKEIIGWFYMSDCKLERDGPYKFNSSAYR